LERALKSFKAKMGVGIDGATMKIIKDTSKGILKELTTVMNKVAKEGMPIDWKLA